MAINNPTNPSLGTPDIKAFPKRQYEKIVEIIAAINAFATSITTTILSVTSTSTFTGIATFTAAPVFKNTISAVTADGAITIPSGNKTFAITKAGVAAMTLANPTSTTHDGLRLTFVATTANAHTLSNAAGAGFNDGGAGSDIGTFGGAKGDNIVIEAYQGKWYVVSKVNVTLA